MPAWIISTLLEMSGPDDPEVQAVLADYIRDERRRSAAVRWLPDIVPEPEELGVMLRDILRDAHVFDSCSALEILVEREGRNAPDLWSLVETRLANDKGGHYWRLGHSTLLKIWPEHPLIRQLAKSDQSTARTCRCRRYIRLMEAILKYVRSSIALCRCCMRTSGLNSPVPSSLWCGEVCRLRLRSLRNSDTNRTAKRAQLRHVPTREPVSAQGSGSSGTDRSSSVRTSPDSSWNRERQQAAVAALLELGRADLVAIQREDGRPLQLSTYSNSQHNWEFVATVVEHWESLAAAVPDIWERFDHSPIIATELAKAGKRAHALSQTQVFENAVRTGEQLQVEQVRALIALHGRSALLRDLFLGRLQFMARPEFNDGFGKSCLCCNGFLPRRPFPRR